MGHNIATKLIAGRWLLLLLAAIITVATFPLSATLEFDRSLENMFSSKDPLLPPLRKLQRTFGGTEIVLLVYQDPGLMVPDGTGIDRVRRVSRQLRKVPGIDDILSLAFLDDMLKNLSLVKKIHISRSPAEGSDS